MVPTVLKFHQARKWGFINMLTAEIPVAKQVEFDTEARHILAENLETWVEV